MFKFIMPSFGILALCLFVTPAQAEPDYAAINTALAEEVIVPAYEHLAASTADLQAGWVQACKMPDVADLSSLRDTYQRVADAWAESFNWNFGPITLLLRRDRFYHWPERRNAIAKNLNALLAKPDEERITDENFSHISVAVQGLPAMERLLFERDDVLTNPWSCKVGLTIAHNMATIAQGAADEWRGEVLETLRKGEEHPIYFDDPKSTLNQMFTELLTGYAIIKDQKILPVLGVSAKKARPNMAEARRSHRFERNLKLNLKTLFAADAVLARSLPEAERKILEQHRAAIAAMLDRLPPIADAVYDEAGRKAYMDLTKAIGAFRAAMVKAYTEHLGVVVGFNSLDGD